MLFNLFSALSGGLAWGLKFRSHGSGGYHKGLNDVQVIALLVTCGVYLLLFVLTFRALRRFRVSGGATGLTPTDNLWEDKLHSCCACCCKAAASVANKQLDKEDAKEA